MYSDLKNESLLYDAYGYPLLNELRAVSSSVEKTNFIRPAMIL